MVTHWKTVSMARTMLSKLVIPWFGPSQFSKQTDSLALARGVKMMILLKRRKTEIHLLPAIHSDAISISTGDYPQHLMLKLQLAKHSFSMYVSQFSIVY